MRIQYSSLLLILLLCLYMCIIGCTDNQNDSQQNDSHINDTEAYLNIYQDILKNNTMIFDTETKTEVLLFDYLADAGLSKHKYSIIDLNDDGNPEMVYG